MMKLRSCVIALLLVLFCSGCSGLFKLDPVAQHWYTLPGAGEVIRIEGSRFAELRLIVRDTGSSAFLNSRKIVFSPDGVEQGFYQFSSWAETPPRRITTLLVDSIERSGLFKSTAEISNAGFGDVQLNTQLIEFYHDTSETPGVARVRISAELLDLRSRELIARTEIVKSAPVESYDARGAVNALTIATHAAIRELMNWIAA